jgi:hypothetical protein
MWEGLAASVRILECIRAEGQCFTIGADCKNSSVGKNASAK